MRPPWMLLAPLAGLAALAVALALPPLAGGALLGLAGAGVAGLLARRATRDGAALAEARGRGEEAAARLAALLDGAPQAIVGLDAEGAIVAWNASAQRLCGFLPKEVLGRPVMTLSPKDLDDVVPQALQRLRHGARVAELHTVWKRRDGKRIEVALRASAVRDGAGRIVGLTLVGRDTTAVEDEQRQRGQELAEGRREAQRLRDAVRRAEEGGAGAAQALAQAMEELATARN
ncbi:MAG: PAS domain-containing protein, partial [Halobacteriales archaeon]|nr:PAS domain-containing protein [Halobacteriales archaeon]